MTNTTLEDYLVVAISNDCSDLADSNEFVNPGVVTNV